MHGWWLCALALGVLSLAPPSANAAQYFVSATGSDTNDGLSPTSAFQSIGKAASLAGPGDVVNIMPGTYAERVAVANSGTADAPVTFRATGDGEVVITDTGEEGGSWAAKRAFLVEGREYVVIDGLTFRDCHAWIALWDSNHCTVQNCTFDGAKTYNCLRINNGSYNRILNCTFKRATARTGFRPEASWIPVPGADYIEIFRGSHNNLVEGCSFGPINHTAVSISAVENEYTPSRNITRNCTFTDPYWKCFWLHKGAHNLVENNVCTGESAAFVQLEGGTNIIRRNVFAHYRDSTNANPDKTLRGVIRMQYDESRDNRIYNNLFYDNERTLTNNSYRWTVFDNIFKNNIFFGNGQTILLGFPDYRMKNRNYFLHNLIQGKAAGQKVIQLESDHFTLAEAQAQLPGLYRGNIEGDPQFQSPDTDDFRLKDGSPCIDAGAPLTVTTSDGSGRDVPVEDALYFCDGFEMIAGDMVTVGSNAPAQITTVDYEGKVLTLDRAIEWKQGDTVNLPFSGAAPDMGPYEAGVQQPDLGRPLQP